MIRAMLFLLAMVGGASSVQAQAYMNFKCADGGGFSLIFEKAGTALVMIDGGALRLQKREAASGLRYASPHGDLRVTGRKGAVQHGRPLADELRQG